MKNPLNSNAIKAQYLTNGFWVILEDLVFMGKTAKRGTITDFASIPKLLRFWISPTDVPIPAIFHDIAIGELRERWSKLTRKERYSQWKVANSNMRFDMKYQGRHISNFKAWCIYIGITINALYMCFVINQKPNLAKTRDDFKEFTLETSNEPKTAKSVWDVYRNAVGGISADDNKLPDFSELGERQKDGWQFVLDYFQSQNKEL